MNKTDRFFRLSFALRAGLCLLIIAVWLLSVYAGNKPAQTVNAGAAIAAPVVAPAVARPSTIKVVTPADYAAELDASARVLIQLCKPDQCAGDRAVLERLQPDFAEVKFVQMNSADNPAFTQRLEKEQELMTKGDSSIGPLVYPVYVFKSSDLQVAPPLKSDHELKQFIATNAAADAPEISK